MPYVADRPLRTLADDSFIDRYAERVVTECGRRLLALVELYTPVSSSEEPRLRAPGTLKASWFIGNVNLRGDVGSVEVLTLDPIACILHGRTAIRTRGGDRPIAQIQVGDEVLTQTGEYRRVTATGKERAETHPEMVDIRYRGIRGTKAKLTVTADHKVLVYRDGRNQWLRAGELVNGDEMYQARPRPDSKRGTGATYVARTCEACGQEYSPEPGLGRGYGERFCSVSCRDAHWADGHNPHLGMKRSEETRQRMRKRWEERERSAPLWYARKGRRTDIELKVEEWLKERGVAYVPQARFGRKVVDFYLPDYHEIVEADGAYFHQDQSVDIARDRALLDYDPTLRVMHLHFFDERHSPALDANPLAGVQYVACNPGPKSFADPESFKRTSISVRPWTYAREGRAGHAFVYDLTVEGIHSFVCKGLIVSNSYVEYPTRPHLIRPRTDRAAASVVETKASRGTVADGRAALRFVIGGRVVYAREVHHPGTKGSRMMGKAIDQLASEWPGIARGIDV